ncbi:MAG: hypothetical protein IJN25_01410 [Clostridia bacterium]|nr:hypothetical protein [Clostridia bacterium]
MQRKTRWFFAIVLLLLVLAVFVAVRARGEEEKANAVFIKEEVYAENRI